LGQPEGRTGNVIPGTDIRFSITTDGRVLVKKGEEPDREVLRSTKVNRFIAVANDLSVFGGVDAENRLWIQQKWDGEPKVISEGVERVLWGPISRRAVVQGPNGRSRLYDNRDGSWKDLGIVLQAEWSPDEEELMFVDGDGTQPGYLSLLSGKSLQQLCAMTRIGQVAKLAFSANQSRAFLLATLGGQMDVWMTPLPRGSAGK
jgi:WD40 repeat protein